MQRFPSVFDNADKQPATEWRKVREKSNHGNVRLWCEVNPRDITKVRISRGGEVVELDLTKYCEEEGIEIGEDE